MSIRRVLLSLALAAGFALQLVAQSEPVANAGAAVKATVGQVVMVDGSLSSDPQDLPLTYFWSFETIPDGSGAFLSDPFDVSPSFVPDIPGDYVLSLTVNNGDRDSAPDFVVVSASNNPPVADAGPPLFPRVGDSVTLDGTLSFDPDGDRLTYQWSFRLKPECSRAILSNATTDTAEFVADCPGTYLLRLTVDDGIVASDGFVVVQTTNGPPTAEAGLDQTAAIGQSVCLDGTGSSDRDGDRISYAWAFLTRPPGSTAALTGPQSAFPCFTPDRAGSYRIRLVTNDGTLNSPVDVVVVSTVNSAPVANAGTDQHVNVGEFVLLDGSRSFDADGQVLRYTWAFVSRPATSAAALDNTTAARPAFGIDVPGTYVVRLTVHDGLVSSAIDTVRITTGNVAPVADAGADRVAELGKRLQLSGAGSSDLDGDEIGFRWALLSQPPGSAAILFNVAALRPAIVPDVPGEYVVQLIATDGRAISAPDTAVITTGNARPIADAGGDQATVLGGAVVLDGTGSRDANGDPLTYHWTLTARPAGSNISVPNFGAMTTILPDRAGIYVVQLRVSDGTLTSAPATAVITTTGFNAVPVAIARAANGESEVRVGTAVMLDGLGSRDADEGAFLTYRWSLLVRPRDSRAELDGPATASPLLTVDTAGTYLAQLVVHDGLNFSAPATVLVVAVPRVNRPPVANAGPDQNVAPGESAMLDGSHSSDPDNDPLRYAWRLVSSPTPGCGTIDETTRTAPIARFTAACEGVYVVTLVVSDGQLSSLPDPVSIVVGRPTIAVAAASVNEGDPAPAILSFHVTLSSASAQPVTVDYATHDVTATAPSDYAAAAGTITFEPGELTRTIPVEVADDALFEAAETMRLELSNPVNASVGDGVAIGTIEDNDPQPSVSIAGASAAEDAATLVFTITQSAASGRDTTVDVATLDGTATAPGDYESQTGTVTIPAGSLSTDIHVVVQADQTFEADETLVVRIGNATNATIGEGDATGTIVNDDPMPAISIEDASVFEGNGGITNMVFTVTQSAVSGLATSVEFATSDGTATAPADYIAASGTITIPAGSMSSTLAVAVIGDLSSEGDETLTVSLANAVHGTISRATAIGTIHDDDAETVITVEATDASATEGGDTATFTFTRAGSVTEPLTVLFTTGGTATLNADYTLTPPGATSVTFLAGQSTATKTVTALVDAAIEPDETVILALAPGGLYSIGSPSVATVIIEHGDPVITVEATDPSATEGEDTATFTFSRTGPTTAPLTVLFSTGGTATLNTDYTLSLGATSVTFAAGQSTATKTVTALSDAPIEPDETVVLTLVGSTLYAVGSPNAATVTLKDATPIITVEATDPSATEGDDTATFTFSRTGSAATQLTVLFSTGGTATLNTDFTFTPAGTTSVTFLAGQTTATKTVTALNDAPIEPNETVVVTLAGGTLYAIGSPNSATVTLIDATPIITVEATDASATEGADTAMFTFSRTGSAATPLTVLFTTGGTASLNTDYTFTPAGATSVTFAAGVSTATKVVTAVNDAPIDPNETVVVTLAGGTLYAIGQPNSATVTVIDTTPTITVEATDASATEGGDTATFTFTRTGPPTSTLTVSFTTAGTAVPNTDYTFTPVSSTSVTFAAGQSTVTKTLNALNDAPIDPNETVVLTLAGGVYFIGSPSSATVTLVDATPIITVEATDATATEGGDTATFTFSRTGDPGSALTVSFTTGGTASLNADYTFTPLGNTGVVFAAGQSTTTKTVTAFNDAPIDPNETVVVTLIGGGPYAIGQPNTATITLVDTTPIVTVAATDASATEGGDTATFTFSRSGVPSTQLTVSFTTAGTATLNTDYTFSPIGNVSVTFAAGQSTTTKTVTALNDAVNDPDETVVVTLVGGTLYAIGSPATATVTIASNIALVTTTTVTVVAADPAASELAADNGAFTITRAGDLGSALTVHLEPAAGTATQSTDYELVGNVGQDIIIPEGQTSATVTVVPMTDALVEGNETVMLTLAAGAGYALGAETSATVTIADGEPPAGPDPADGPPHRH